MDNQRLLVGIDFSKKRADLALLKSDGELLIRHRAFTNTQVGFEQLKQSECVNDFRQLVSEFIVDQ